MRGLRGSAWRKGAQELLVAKKLGCAPRQTATGQGDSFKVHQERFGLDIWRNFFTGGAIGPWKGLPSIVLDVLKERPEGWRLLGVDDL